MKRVLYILLLLLVPYFLSAQVTDSMSVVERNAAQGFNDTIDRMADDFVTVSLVVADPCDVLYSTLGHAALHLQCPTFGLDYVFSYESEDVTSRIWTFLKGNLKMGMFAIPTEDFLQGYRDEHRGVREYKLNLSPTQKQDLWRVMDQHVMEGANIPYDYFHRGCAKSIVIVVREALGNTPIEYAQWPDKYTKQTQRELVRNFITDAPWSEFEMYFLIGVDGDKDYPCEKKLIVPTDLVEVWQQAKLNGTQMLSSDANILVPSDDVKRSSWYTPGLVAIVLLILAILSFCTIFVNNPNLRYAGLTIDYLILVLQSVMGFVMTYLICFSHLPCTSWNWLFVPFNILPAIFWHWRKYWSLPYSVVLIVWVMGMLIYPHVLVDWIHILFAIDFALILLKNSNIVLRHEKYLQNEK